MAITQKNYLIFFIFIFNMQLQTLTLINKHDENSHKFRTMKPFYVYT